MSVKIMVLVLVVFACHGRGATLAGHVLAVHTSITIYFHRKGVVSRHIG